MKVAEHGKADVSKNTESVPTSRPVSDDRRAGPKLQRTENAMKGVAGATIEEVKVRNRPSIGTGRSGRTNGIP